MIIRFGLKAPFCALVLCAAALTMSSRPAAADGCFISFNSFVGVGAGVTPEFLGSDELEVTPFFDACLDFGERYVEVLGRTARAQIFNLRHLHGGPVVTFREGREAGNLANPNLGSEFGFFLPSEVDDSFEVGGFLELREQDVLGEQDSIALRIEATQDVTDGHGGFQASLSGIYRRKWYEKLESAINVSGRFNSDNFADAFFSVDAPSASDDTLPGADVLPPFQAGGGVQQIGALLTTTYHFADRWSITGNVDASYLIGDAGDSPIVGDAGLMDDGEPFPEIGQPFQLTAGFTVNYKFWRR